LKPSCFFGVDGQWRDASSGERLLRFEVHPPSAGKFVVFGVVHRALAIGGEPAGAAANVLWLVVVLVLNDAQHRAVFHRGAPLLVLAGAGTGKTRVITERIAQLLMEGVPAWRILAVTFTNKAAGEMRSRIAARCASTPELQGIKVEELWVGTFHAIAAKILRRHASEVGLTKSFSVYDSSDQKTLMTRVLKDLAVGDRAATPQSILWHIDQAKNAGWGRQEIRRLGLDLPLEAIVVKAWELYERRLRAADAVDFGDLLTLCASLLARQADPEAQLGEFDPILRLRTRFHHVVVDEFQDTNPVQAAMVDRLSSHATLCVVGDDDQSIYGWRGADVNIFLDFANTHPGCEVVRLEQNYRSTQHVLDCADAVIRRNKGRLGKKLWCDTGPGEKVRVLTLEDEREEANFIARDIATAIAHGESASECAVFYRTHAQSRAIEEALRHIGVRYRMVGGTRFFDRAEVKDILAYLRLLVVPASDLDCQRIINRPARGIGDTTVERLAQYASENGVSLLDACRRGEQAGLGSAAKKKVEAFVALYDDLVRSTSGKSLAEVAQSVIDLSGYRATLVALGDVESESKLENIQELVSALETYVEEYPEATLAEYLEQASLASDGDAPNLDALTLMTVHSAKGLEFQRVYMSGMEERVFPHARSYEEPEQMEEERRLAYVAITRARHYLTLTSVRQRSLWGQHLVGTPSRFVRDLPEESLHVGNGRAGTRRASAQPERSAQRPAAKSSDAWDNDIVRDADAAEAGDGENVTLYVGLPVKHSKYGRGEVVGWSGAGSELKLSIRFVGVGTKMILSRFVDVV
jgi:DNA helicase-2/ATP-dependent DNA helicase PcrA